MEKLQNTKCSIEYRPGDKEIFGQDLTDKNNLPAFYTKSKRGILKAWDKLKTIFNEDTSLHDVIRLMIENGIKTHYWCMMD